VKIWGIQNLVSPMLKV